MGNDGIILVEQVDGAPGNMFVARVKMPGGHKQLVAFERGRHNPQTVIFSLEAMAMLWAKYPPAPTEER